MAPVRSVERALNILFLIARSDQPLGLTEVSRAADIDKATVLRLLLTLESFKLIQRDPLTRRYSPGSGLWHLVKSWRNDLRSVSLPYLESLRRATEETVQLVCPRGLERVVVTALPGPNELSVNPTIGVTHPIYVGASGKALMAFLSDDERDRIIELTNLKPLNPQGIADRATFLRLLRDIRQHGFATSIGDVTLGASAVAAPVFDADGKVIAAVSLRAPEIRLPPARINQLAPLVMEVAAGISRELGYDPDESKSA